MTLCVIAGKAPGRVIRAVFCSNNPIFIVGHWDGSIFDAQPAMEIGVTE